MDKYKIMIVDDEAAVREGVVNRIDWDSLGFEVAAEAENGQDALEKAENTPIDVVLTDIKMPFMDGLVMCERLRRQYPSLKIIILTGFNEFAFAKTAIKLNVVEYVLKPVNVAELSDIMRRVHRQLEQEVAEKRDMDALRARYEEALPLMRENFLNELLWGVANRNDLQERMHQYGITVAEHRYQLVAVFEIERPRDPDAVEWELAPLSVKQLVAETLEGQCDCEVYISTSFIIALTGWDGDDPGSEMMRMANEICLRSTRLFSLAVTAGISRAYSSMADVTACYQEARAALEYKAVTGPGRAIYIQDMEQPQEGEVLFDSRSEQQLISVIKFGTYEQIQMHLDEMQSRIEGASEWDQQGYILDVFNALFRIIQRYNLQAESVITERMQTLLREQESWKDSGKLGERLGVICFCMSECLMAKRVTASRRLVEEGKAFISENYHDQELSLERISSHLHVSQTYFSSIFKQEEGVSYVRYLTELRLAKAVTLLQETDHKTYVIAKMVGYDEPNYFSYVFKKHYGISPTKFRKQKDELYEEVSGDR